MRYSKREKGFNLYYSLGRIAASHSSSNIFCYHLVYFKRSDHLQEHNWQEIIQYNKSMLCKIFACGFHAYVCWDWQFFSKGLYLLQRLLIDFAVPFICCVDFFTEVMCYFILGSKYLRTIKVIEAGMIWVGRDLRRSSSPLPLPRQGWNKMTWNPVKNEVKMIVFF